MFWVGLLVGGTYGVAFGLIYHEWWKIGRRRDDKTQET